MHANSESIGDQSTMKEVLEAFPGAQRALFRRYHIGGCSSCGFQPTETLETLCQRNNGLNVQEVLDHIKESHEQDEKIFISALEVSQKLKDDPDVKLLDVRAREEFETVRIENSILLSQPTMQEIMGKWAREQMIVIIDHQGKKALDAAAYFLGQGFKNVRCMKGGIDAWSREVNPKVPRYRLENTTAK